MKVANETVVSIHYTLTNDDKEVLDSSDGQDPLTYLHGAGGLIPGLEKELEGKSAGDSMNVTVAPAEGYGEPNDSLVQTVPMSAFEGVEKVEAGMQFRASGEDGSAQMITVTGVEGDAVTIDGNHPLAGVTLHFAVEVIDVREATEEERQHGHAH